MKQRIKDIIRDNSGGLKLIQLVTILADRHAEVQDMDVLLTEIRSISELGVLEYVWPMGDGAYRLKYFVYWKRVGLTAQDELGDQRDPR